MDTLMIIICHSQEALTVHCHSTIPATPWSVLDDLLALAKLPPVPDRVHHLQEELQNQGWGQGRGQHTPSGIQVELELEVGCNKGAIRQQIHM